MRKPTRVAAALMHVLHVQVLYYSLIWRPRPQAGGYSRDVRVHVRGALAGILVCGLIKLDFLGEEVDVD